MVETGAFETSNIKHNLHFVKVEFVPFINLSFVFLTFVISIKAAHPHYRDYFLHSDFRNVHCMLIKGLQYSIAYKLYSCHRYHTI